MPVAAAFSAGLTSLIPIYVFLNIGNSPYAVSAIIAGVFPIPINGIRKASTARLGIVCITAEAPITGSAIRLYLVSINPSGTAMKIGRASCRERGWNWVGERGRNKEHENIGMYNMDV